MERATPSSQSLEARTATPFGSPEDIVKPRLAIAFALIVLIPVALLSWLGVRLVAAERRNVEQRFHELYRQKLADIDQSIHRLVREREAELLQLTEVRDADADTLRARTRQTAFVSQMFLVEPEGRIAFPPADDTLSPAEKEFLDRARRILTERIPSAGAQSRTNRIALAELPRRAIDTVDEQEEKKDSTRFALARKTRESEDLAPEIARKPTAAVGLRLLKEKAEAPSSIVVIPTPVPEPLDVAGMGRDIRKPAEPFSPSQQTLPSVAVAQQQAASIANAPTPPASRDHGWYVWFWGRGIHLIFWRLDEAGRIVGAELDRVRFLADVIGLLPETPASSSTAPPGRLVLADGLGQVLYQWGGYDPPTAEAPVAELPLRYPLSAWTLRQFVPAVSLSSFGADAVLFNVLAGSFVAGLAFLAVAFFFYRESTRELREAAQRVSFVNQVSHELKTPLTNIRMYAELLDESLDEEDTPSRGRLAVIVAESRRLSRLIGNMLSFSRKQRSKLAVHPQPCVVDEVVRSVIENFRAAFDGDGVEIEFDSGAGSRVMADPDAIEQILGNLLSNVEKYAANGGWAGIETRAEDDHTTIRVRDRGPGVARTVATRIFEPFQRGSDRLTEGVSGTGIGLAISRDLARLHGGDLALTDCPQGACFTLRIRTPQAPQGDTR